MRPPPLDGTLDNSPSRALDPPLDERATLHPVPEEATKYALIRERSRVWAEARSSLHPVRMESAGLEGYVDADVSGGQVRLAPAAHVELAVELLRSSSSLLDGELQRRLEALRYPRIEGDLREVKPLGGQRWLLRGDLTLHGVRKAMDVEVTVNAREGMLEIEGEKLIDMRDFGLQPPRLFFLRVDPQVRIRAQLVTGPETPGARP